MSEPVKPEFRRSIRSFVLREGRATPGQKKAYERLWPQFGLEYQADHVLDLSAIFGNDHPVTLEIGFGDGESLAEQAERNPQRNFLGIEVHGPGVGHLLLQAEQRELKNLRIIRHDAIDVLKVSLATASLQRVQLFFPDPWPKKKHHKRRILQSTFLALVHRVLADDGVFHAATDWEDYALHMLEVLEGDPGFSNQSGAGRYAPRPEDRPETKFERRGQRLGHAVWDLLYQKITPGTHSD